MINFATRSNHSSHVVDDLYKAAARLPTRALIVFLGNVEDDTKTRCDFREGTIRAKYD